MGHDLSRLARWGRSGGCVSCGCASWRGTRWRRTTRARWSPSMRSTYQQTLSESHKQLLTTATSVPPRGRCHQITHTMTKIVSRMGRRKSVGRCGAAVAKTRSRVTTAARVRTACRTSSVRTFSGPYVQGQSRLATLQVLPKMWHVATRMTPYVRLPKHMVIANTPATHPSVQVHVVPVGQAMQKRDQA